MRAPVAADAETLTDLHLDVWEEAYRGLIPEQALAARRRDRDARVVRWRRQIEAGTAVLRVAEIGRRMVGLAQAGEGRDDDPGLPARELMALYVRADCYGAGVGSALFDAVIGRGPAYLWVLDGNTRAIGFYRRQGFELEGRVRTEAVGVERLMVR